MPDDRQTVLDQMLTIATAFGFDFEPYGSDGKSRLGRKGDWRCLLLYEQDLAVNDHDDLWIVHGPDEHRYGGHTVRELAGCLVDIGRHSSDV